jgi:8-oxo-dGTP pyrophosphatase MutT (NUDIX family)
MGLKARVFKVVSVFLQQPWARLTRGMTLGSRVAVLDGEGRVMLVRHTYSPGWILPGGGVERGETLAAAALREIREEAGIIGQAPILHGIFSNEPIFKGDHVACFVVREFTQVAWTPNLEIAEAKFFPTHDLPADTTGGTRRRLAEILGSAPVSEMW